MHNHLVPVPASALAATLALAALSLPAVAAPFEFTHQQRWISIGASISVENAGGAPGGSGAAGDYYAMPASDFGAMDREVGLNGGPLGDVGFAGGRAVQRSSMTGDAISFYGFGDVYVQLVGAGDVITGGGSTSSGFSSTFRVAAPTTVLLSLYSTPSLVGNDFQFGLSKASGEMVWGQSSIEQPEGPPLYSFAQRLELAPGLYNIGGFVGANYSIDGIGDPRAEGSFSLVAVVPEPATGLLLTAGLAAVAAAATRRKARAILPG